MIAPERMAELEFEALQQEKQNKLNARLQVWSLLVGLVGASGVASVQSGAVAYVVLLYPLLAACVARYAGHSESVLDQVKAYLLELEKRANYSGYEQFNKSNGRKGVGAHVAALRDAILLTDVLAVGVVVLRLFSSGLSVLAVLVMLSALVVLLVTCRWLSDGKEGAGMGMFFEKCRRRGGERFAVNQLVQIWNGLDASKTEESAAVETLMEGYGYTLTRDTETGAYIWNPDVLECAGEVQA